MFKRKEAIRRYLISWKLLNYNFRSFDIAHRFEIESNAFLCVSTLNFIFMSILHDNTFSSRVQLSSQNKRFSLKIIRPNFITDNTE